MAIAKTTVQEIFQPEKIVLDAPYAYYDDDNNLHAWQACQIIEDTAMIAELIARGAPLQPADI